jgi:hypothetical protein
MTRSPASRIALITAIAAILVAVPSAFAGKGATKPNNGNGRLDASGSLRMVLVDSTDGIAHYGQRVRFDISTTAPWPFVDVDCSQAGSAVYHSTVGYYGGWTNDSFTLAGWAWAGGAADCTARLYNADASGATTLATLSFHVAD